MRLNTYSTPVTIACGPHYLDHHKPSSFITWSNQSPQQFYPQRNNWHPCDCRASSKYLSTGTHHTLTWLLCNISRSSFSFRPPHNEMPLGSDYEQTSWIMVDPILSTGRLSIQISWLLLVWGICVCFNLVHRELLWCTCWLSEFDRKYFYPLSNLNINPT